MTKRYADITFLRSSEKLEQLPKDEGAEVAFIGRSNVGKSSAINTIAGKKDLARVGKTPGVTQLLNIFVINADLKTRLIDLPGYGYAQVPKTVRADWKKRLYAYLQGRESLRGLFLLIDSRHLLQEQDQELLDFAEQIDLPVAVLLTKSDKLSRTEMEKILQQMHSDLNDYQNEISVQLFSAKTGLGLAQVFAQLELWLGKSGKK